MKSKRYHLATALCLSATPCLVAAQAPTALNNLVVTATDTDQQSDQITDTVIVIDRQEIERKQYQTLNDALQHQPGFSVKRSGGAGQQSSTYLRGFSQDNLLILINGIEQTDPSGLSGANLHLLQLANVERIEILKGAQSSVWGPNAAVGVINIITRSSPGAQIGLEIGSHGHKRLQAALNQGNEQVDFGASLSTLNVDGFSAVHPYNDTSEGYEDDAHHQTDVAFKLGVNLTSNHRLEAQLQSSTATTDYDGSSDPDADNQIDYDQVAQSLRYRYHRGPWLARLQLHHNRIERAYHTGFGTSTYEGTLSEKKGTLKRTYRSHDFFQIGANQKTYDSQSSFDNHQSYTQNGLNLTNHNQFGKGWSLTESVRHDRFDAFENALTGKVGLRKQWASAYAISIHGGTGYKAPLLSQLKADNPAPLDPEQSRSLDVRVELGDLTATWFKADIRDKIEAEGTYPNYVYVNADQETRSQGIELNYQADLTALNLSLAASMTWQQVENEDGEAKAYVPERTAQLSLDYRAFVDALIGLDAHYTGTQYPADDRQGKQIGEYTVLDLRAQYQLTPSLELYGRIENLTNADYINAIADYPATNTPPQYIYGNGERRVYLGVRTQL
ncbi:TonB-dependent siderophore receptor [Thiomicrospira sp. WB1]|uniref:TonB-dependent receptor plug domain-containing protein n=1 Tax=Thiomicrospira sp. WB1 TaxID=1685380 RepID=UPI0007466DCE|nr:TonB-dependent receptor [Thiomicrospira sp. WB1]KUJ72851.1 hypothetical protein AVO41_03475 [Thiomicrospira sp. WB1]